MYYVVLELDVEHKIETPKDHTRVTKISYQIIEENNLKCQNPNESPLSFITIDHTANAFQDAIIKLDGIIKNVAKETNFVICSLYSTWHIRVTLPREARDLNYDLPSYILHPVIFDLRKEFQRWSHNHPEVTSTEEHGREKFENNEQILTNNEVNEKPTIINQISKAFNITDDKNTEKINTTTEVLFKLYKECTTDDDKTKVLTQPYDSLADYKAFLERESTALYINNLPPDTTQSELESWFSQFGSRPIGFWTIRHTNDDSLSINWDTSNNCPYVEEADSVSGFIVYQTSDEAKNALSLNGRSILSNVANIKQPQVVEHVVEIEPSCTEVLDKAYEILSPFPQSKNKPRPGDWTCPSCGFSNFQRRTACFRCSFPIPSSVNNKIDGYNINNGDLHNTTNNNGNNESHSHNYNQHIYSNSPVVRGSMNINSHNNTLNHYGNSNASNMGNNNSDYNRYNNNNSNTNNISGSANDNSNNSHSGSNVPFRAGDWKCASCMYHNFAKNVICLRCSGPKTRTVNTSNVRNYLNNQPLHSNNYNYNNENVRRNATYVTIQGNQ